MKEMEEEGIMILMKIEEEAEKKVSECEREEEQNEWVNVSEEANSVIKSWKRLKKESVTYKAMKEEAETKEKKMKEEMEEREKRLEDEKERWENEKRTLEKKLAEAQTLIPQTEKIEDFSSTSARYSNQSAFTISGNSITHNGSSRWNTVTFGPMLRNV